MRTRSSSPIHVHVSEATPVHVHVKGQKSSTRTHQGKVKHEMEILRPTAKVKTRGPWIPPGKSRFLDASYKWEGPSHCLEVTPQSTNQEPEGSQSVLRLADLTNNEHAVDRRIKQYEQKIDSLMAEVSSLKNEVEVKKKEQLFERQSMQLNVSQRIIVEQKQVLAAMTKELQQTEVENAQLRHSMEKMQAGNDNNSVDCQQPNKDELLSKLMQAEVDGKAASEQISALSQSVCKMSSANGGLSAWESSHLDRQKQLVLQNLETFETTNKALRQLLRERHELHMDSAQLSEQKETLLEKLSNTEAENATLVVILQDKEKQVDDLCKALDNEKENAMSVSHLSKSLESTRAHLQGQLRCKEAENNRLTVQIKNLEHSIKHQKTEMGHLTEQLLRLKQHAMSDKEALKQAARAQRQRAERCEDSASQLHLQLLEMKKQTTEALSAAETWENRHKEVINDKNKLEVELSALNSKAVELSGQLKSAENKGRMDRDALVHHLHGLNSENTAVKLENQSLKATVSTLEEKLSLSQSELQQVKCTIKQYQNLIDSYKIQVGKTQAEVDEYCARLTKAEADARAVRGELDQEIEQVRRDLQGRLAELEPLPEALRHVENKLLKAQEQELNHETANKELSKTMNELLLKIQTGDSHSELLKQNNKVLLEENRKLQLEVEKMERKLKEAGSQNCELLTVAAKWETSLQTNQLRLEEKNRECSLLNRKLEDALMDAQQQITGIRERSADKGRSTQSKVLELETQLSRTTTEINQLRQSKEEAEQRYQSRLQDIKDRLEQSDSTNRSLQNYVEFLKTSYANVFGDMSLRSSFRAPSPV